jgi:hypothetical protein
LVMLGFVSVIFMSKIGVKKKGVIEMQVYRRQFWKPEISPSVCLEHFDTKCLQNQDCTCKWVRYDE